MQRTFSLKPDKKVVIENGIFDRSDKLSLKENFQWIYSLKRKNKTVAKSHF